jgi:eukaryotic-like serine/threonine-protein kinase
MTPQDRQKVKELCALALEKPSAQRRSFLAQACPDEFLRREVETMLEGAAQGVGVRDLRGDAITLDKPERRIPTTLGPYRVLHLLGEGGMGSVYKVEQDRPHRIVALKVIKPGLATPELLRRFERESEALARLHHPGIAQIYEVGTADAGYGPQPYFAMEFINGAPLRDYARSHRLNTRQWL